jgi:hypothetical protein
MSSWGVHHRRRDCRESVLTDEEPAQQKAKLLG